MNFEELLASLGVYGASVVVGVISGLLPLPIGESYLLLLWSKVSPLALPLTITIIVAIQVAIRVPMYYVASRADHVPSRRWKAKLDRARARMEKWKDKPKWILFIAAVIGIPPYYLAVLVAGLLKMPLRTFVLVSFFGRLMHYTAIAFSPVLFR